MTPIDDSESSGLGPTLGQCSAPLFAVLCCLSPINWSGPAGLPLILLY